MSPMYVSVLDHRDSLGFSYDTGAPMEPMYVNVNPKLYGSRYGRFNFQETAKSPRPNSERTSNDEK
eukprot:10165550-Alexandrium_andersonii.AAC.1